MSYFLYSGNLKIGEKFEIVGDELTHLISRRVKEGEALSFQGTDFKRYKCEVVEVKPKSISISPFEEVVPPQESQNKITLFQSVVNEQAFDFILQKSTELGADKIVLFNSVNTATKLSIDKFNRKQERWNKILWESAKQCDRIKPPALEYLSSVEDVIKSMEEYQKAVLLDPAGTQFKDLKIERFNNLAVIIGPEGGLTKEEVEKFKKLPNYISLSLGSILLRAETAALASLTLIINE